MKSALEEVEGLYRCLFRDIEVWHPSILVELRRDLSLLQSEGRSSGLPYYTITLPTHSKYLNSSLEEGFLIDKRPHLLGAKSSVDKRPKLYYGLWSQIFEADGTLKNHPDISAIASIRQISLAVKKLNMECKPRYVEQSITEFREIEKSLPALDPAMWGNMYPRWRRNAGHPLGVGWDLDSNAENLRHDSRFAVSSDSGELDWEGFSNFVARFSSQLGTLDPLDVVPKHGPGAVSDHIDGYVKYDHRRWTERLEIVFPYGDFAAPSLDPEWLEYVSYEESPSRLIAVPKTQSGPRLIACEPTSHQWIQGGLQRWLERRISMSILSETIDFRSQEVSRQMALDSSWTGSHATVDLSSASDRLSANLVSYCFQGNFSLLTALNACRTKWVDMDGEGDILPLRKFSTQGSACTFPVQTIVYALLSVWAVGLTRGTRDWYCLADFAKEVRVFGDDIIVPTDAYPVLTRLLSECGLKVNTSKSFSRGKFRESCGMDAYDGIDITPAYFRQLLGLAPTSTESIVECSNNFFQKGYWFTAEYIQKILPEQDRKKIMVKAVGDGAFGFASFCGSDVTHLPSRYNRYLHRDEVQVFTIRKKVVRTRGQGHGDLLQFFVEEPDPLLPYQGGEVASVKARKGLTWVEPPQ